MATSVEIRRHSVRDNPAPHLSDAGPALARDVAALAPRFDRVVSSPLPRATETAEALGYPSPEVDPLFESVGAGVEPVAPWPSPFSSYRKALDLRVTDVVRKAQQLGTSLRRIAADLPEKGHALVVTHGGVPELCAVALRPEDDAGAWGEPCRCLEGVRITFVGEVPEQVVILRVDPRRTRL